MEPNNYWYSRYLLESYRSWIKKRIAWESITGSQETVDSLQAEYDKTSKLIYRDDPLEIIRFFNPEYLERGE